MVYPPGEVYTPRPSPERRSSSSKIEVCLLFYKFKLNFKCSLEWMLLLKIKSFEHPGIDGGVASSESHYQYGPDTYLLQLRDVDFPVRLRQYMKVK